MKLNWFKLSAPATFYPVAGKMIPWFAWLAAITTVGGLYWGFFQTPDTLSEQREYYRIIFVHVPAAWMSMWLYVVMVCWAAAGLVFGTRLSFMMAASIAPSGAIFTFLALWTGAFWGKTSWGTYWDWDPRMTTELILLFLYMGYIALQSAIDDSGRADRASGILAVVGLACVPVIFYSINCPDPNQCAALHQRSGVDKMEPNILAAMMVMVFAFWMYSFATCFMRIRNIILERERDSTWLSETLETEK